MSLRSADLRFLLPRAPHTALVSSSLPAVGKGVEEAGMSMTEHSPDLAVVTAREAAAAIAAGARATIVVGRGGRRALRRKVPVLRRFVTLPGPLEPHLILPVDRPGVAAYAIRTWASSESRRRRLRNALAASAMRAGAFPDLPRSLTLGLSADEPPYLVAAAERLGVPRNADWFLTLGVGDALTRAVFQLFAPGDDEPQWVLKLSRVAGYTDPFDRDERGLRLAAQAGRVAAAHAPRFLGRLEVDGLAASVEQAAPGMRLTYLLRTPGPRSSKLRAIEAVARWVIDVAKQTAAPPDALSEERRRLENDVLGGWREAGIPADLVARVPAVPAVLVHNDLGCWNLVTGRDGFMAVDWESARRHGMPLWDLLYFLVDAFVLLDGAWAEDRRESYAARLLRGETASSATVFRWVREAVETLAIPPTAVGPIATLGWLHHGLSHLSRDSRADTLAPGLRSADTYGEWMVRVWLDEPGLGPGWSAWRG